MSRCLPRYTRHSLLGWWADLSHEESHLVRCAWPLSPLPSVLEVVLAPFPKDVVPTPPVRVATAHLAGLFVVRSPLFAPREAVFLNEDCQPEQCTPDAFSLANDHPKCHLVRLDG